MSKGEPLLDVRGLSVDIRQGATALRVVNELSLTVRRGEAVGLVGESGSGKSMTAFAVMNLFPSPLARVAAGQVLLEGRDLAQMAPAELRATRGARVGMVFQDPTSYLDPLMPVGRQIAEPLRAHGRTEGLEARVLELLDLMELPNAARVARQYPHELSGGMRQRILIATALAMQPALLIADEPTTALDVTVQAEVLDLLRDLQRERSMAMILVTHNFGVVADICDRVAVMYAGEVVEKGPVADVLRRPIHPYTRALLSAIPRPDTLPGQLPAIEGSPPDLAAPPPGCRFAPRCPLARPDCAEPPPLVTVGPEHSARCVLAGDDIAPVA